MSIFGWSRIDTTNAKEVLNHLDSARQYMEYNPDNENVSNTFNEQARLSFQSLVGVDLEVAWFIDDTVYCISNEFSYNYLGKSKKAIVRYTFYVNEPRVRTEFFFDGSNEANSELTKWFIYRNPQDLVKNCLEQNVNPK